MLSKYFKQAVHEVSFPVTDGAYDSHLESRINHLLFETGRNQEEHTSDGQGASTDIMT